MFWKVAQVGLLSCGKFQKLSVVARFPCWNHSQNAVLQPFSSRVAASYSQKRSQKSPPIDNSQDVTAVFPTLNIGSPADSSIFKSKDLTKIETRWYKYPKIYMTLSKWYLTLFVAMTADAGYCLAPVVFDQQVFLFATVGTVLCSCAANTFNQIIEVEYDGLMDRTKNRPLVRSIITPLHATMFAVSSGVVGVSCLYYGVNGLTAALGLANILLYAGIYTPMKRRHWFNTWAGSIVGAIPPIMGWTAATGSLDAGAFILAGILYCWQFPHFFALAWRRKNDYARGNYHMLPLSHPQATKHVAVGHSLALCGLSLAAPLTGITSWVFVALSAPFNAWLMTESIKFHRKGNSSSASKLYKCSLYYILAVSFAMVLDRKVIMKAKKKWKEEHSS